MENITYEIIALLFFSAFFAGMIDTMAGGGGLITLPALILSGLPTLTALGTNKFQSSFGTMTASFMMFKNKQVQWKDVRLLMLSAFIGSAFGTICIQYVNTDTLQFIIPAVLFIVGVYFLVSPQAKAPKKPRLCKSRYTAWIVPSIGFYDGFFGPGTGSFFSLAGVALRGQHLLKSTAIAKTLNFSTNFAALLMFVFAGKVAWVIGLVMVPGSLLGAWIGSHILFSINVNYLRFVVVFVCFAMLTKYIFEIFL